MVTAARIGVERLLGFGTDASKSHFYILAIALHDTSKTVKIQFLLLMRYCTQNIIIIQHAFRTRSPTDHQPRLAKSLTISFVVSSSFLYLRLRIFFSRVVSNFIVCTVSGFADPAPGLPLGRFLLASFESVEEGSLFAVSTIYKHCQLDELSERESGTYANLAI